MGEQVTDSATKTCKMCFMAIPVQAKKCPHCHHYQYRLSAIMFHPVFGALVVGVPMLVLLGPLQSFFWKDLFGNGEDYQRYSSQIQITDSKMAFGETKTGATVTVIGTLRNSSPIPWKDIRYQVDFQDANGRRVDTGQQEPYGYFLPATNSLSFKVSFRREFPESNYVHHTIQIVSAKDGRTRW
jgi:hypothetical protein